MLYFQAWPLLTLCTILLLWMVKGETLTLVFILSFVVWAFILTSPVHQICLSFWMGIPTWVHDGIHQSWLTYRICAWIQKEFSIHCIFNLHCIVVQFRSSSQHQDKPQKKTNPGKNHFLTSVLRCWISLNTGGFFNVMGVNFINAKPKSTVTFYGQVMRFLF